MSYKIQILSDEEFESLPYPETTVSLGIADPKTNTAYVRYTQSDELNKYLINHELEHLIDGHGGEHSDHYRNGVYYKGFGQVLGGIAPFLNFIPGIGPLLSIGAGLGGGIMNSRDQAKQQKQSMMQQGYQQQQPQYAFPSQQDRTAAPTMGTAPTSMGASGSTGALGQQPSGSPVDKLRTGYDEIMAQRQKGYGF